MSRHAARPRSAGFTLVELLVVMGIIAILMAFLVPTLAAIRHQANVNKVTAIIHGISGALEAYKQAYQVYPPDKKNESDDAQDLNLSSECLVYYLSGGSIYYINGTSSASYPWQHAVYQSSGRKNMTIYLSFNRNLLADKDGDGAPELYDPWGKRFIYNSGVGTDGDYNQYGAADHNFRKCDLLSGGPDKTYATADDIANYDDELTDDYSQFNSGMH